MVRLRVRLRLGVLSMKAFGVRANALNVAAELVAVHRVLLQVYRVLAAQPIMFLLKELMLVRNCLPFFPQIRTHRAYGWL